MLERGLGAVVVVIELWLGYLVGGLLAAAGLLITGMIGLLFIWWPETIGEILGRACYSREQCYVLPTNVTKFLGWLCLLMPSVYWLVALQLV